MCARSASDMPKIQKVRISYSANIFLVIESQDIPVFTQLPNAETTVYIGDSVTLPCSTDGNPSPKVVAWLFNEKRVDTRSGRHFLRPSGSLYISKTEKSDAGTYQCVAQNTVGGVASEKKELFIACEFLKRIL